MASQDRSKKTTEKKKTEEEPVETMVTFLCHAVIKAHSYDEFVRKRDQIGLEITRLGHFDGVDIQSDDDDTERAGAYEDDDDEDGDDDTNDEPPDGELNFDDD